MGLAHVRPITKVVLHSGGCHVTLYFAKLLKISQHDNSGRVLLPDHPPEVIHSLIKGALCCYVLLYIPVTLQQSKNGLLSCPIYKKAKVLR